MKLKSRPEDFRVEELARPEMTGGPFALYRLTKKSLGTPEAVNAICRAWRVSRPAVGIGGLKDRHAVTQQFLSIENGPKRNLKQTNIELEYLGQTPRAFESRDLLGNRFDIVLRDLDSAKADRAVQNLPVVSEEGIPNYFDDQRFGSVGASGDFVARAWCLGDYERALWLALAEPNEHDRPGVRAEKESLRAHWGDWATCRENVSQPVTQSAMQHLCGPAHDFRGAFVRIPQPDRRMYLAAFQSFLWNRILAAVLRTAFASSPNELFDVELGRTRLPFYARLPSGRERLEQPLPLPSARERAELGPLAEMYERAAGEFGLECRQLRVKYPRDSFFSKGSRPPIFRQSLSWETGADELSPGKRKLALRFDLPPGSYATVVIKRLAAGA